MVEEGHEQGLIEEGEMELINNIFEFGDKEAKDIMTPRQKIVAVENTQTVEQALQLAVENNFPDTRFMRRIWIISSDLYISKI